MLNIKETNSTESHQQAPTHDQQVPTVETTSKVNIKTDQKNTHLAPPQQESLGEPNDRIGNRQIRRAKWAGGSRSAG